ncbi:MAG: 2-hydroxychromene-2-carboxylate isomerase [Proteobacteria bacterium]|nr:2-hydroxychromene-2-carboxylate isomerase [Pseudomonadota bacterium]MDA0992266.1 2-hydroxychromene-2-carboxylate isomerase [Pseudomonadota bacterium]
MSHKLEFFFDYVSTYSYLANSQVAAIRAEVVYRPMFLGGVMRATGNSPPMTVAAKGSYLNADVARWVERYAIPYKMNPVFPQNTVNALRLAIVAQREGCFEAIHRALFDAMWIHGKNLEDTECLAKIATSAGMSAAAFEGIGTESIKDELRKNTDEAISRGAFGAPTFYVGDEMFFGNDRFDFIEKALRLRN